MSPAGVVNLDLTSQAVASAIAAAAATLPPDAAELLTSRLERIVVTVKRARYKNLYDLLGNNIQVPHLHLYDTYPTPQPHTAPAPAATRSTARPP